MRILNIEDDVIKHSSICRALKQLGKIDIDLSDNMQEGIDMIRESISSGIPYALVISDMNYPVDKNTGLDSRAGIKLIEYLKENSIDIPVIICSYVRYDISGLCGCIWFNESYDWENALLKAVKNCI